MHAARPGGFCKELKQHIALNVRVSLAISLAAVLKFTADKKLSEETLAYPILCEVLDLVQMKVAEDFVFLRDEMLQNWMAIPPVSSRWMYHQNLNDCLELTHLHQANADFVKV